MNNRAEKARFAATANFLHDGRSLRPGQEFEATEADGEELVAIGFARKLPPQQRQHPTYSTKEEHNADAAESPEAEAKPRRRYNRRDMKAEES